MTALVSGRTSWRIGTPSVTFAQVARLEDEIAALPMAACPVVEYHTGDMYVREMTIPKGVVAVGVVHKTRHIVTISKGDVTIWTDGGVMKRLQAPCTFMSEPGAKRAAYAHEETVLTTYHATTETDTAKLIELLTDAKADELLGQPNCRQIKNQLSQESPICHLLP